MTHGTGRRVHKHKIYQCNGEKWSDYIVELIAKTSGGGRYLGKGKKWPKWPKMARISPQGFISPQNGHFLGGISNWFPIVVQNWNCFSLQPLFFWFYWYIDIISMISPTITISSQIHDLCGVWSSSDWHLHNIDFSSQCNKDFCASSSWLIMAPMWGLNFSFQQHWSGDLRSIYHFYRVCFSKPKLISI